MGIGMARSATRNGLSFLVALGLLAVAGGATGQSTPEPPAVAKECGNANMGATPLPNSSLALQKDRKLTILAIGASSTAVLGSNREGSPPLLEQILERAIKGLDVEIINRGFSGELAQAAGQRLRVEVALNHPDIVLWQVGTNDAFAQVPVEEFEATVAETVRWLKEHQVDVILVGLHYMKQLATNEYYQAIRASLNRITTTENVMRITRYEAMEFLAQTARENGANQARDFGFSEAGYNCMAQYVARAIAVGLFAKPGKHAPVPPQ